MQIDNLNSREGCHLHLLYKLERALPDRLMDVGELDIHEFRETMLHNLYDLESVQHAVDMTVQSGHLYRGLRLKSGHIVWGDRNARAEAHISEGYIFDAFGNRYSADDIVDVVYCVSNSTLVSGGPEVDDKVSKPTMFERVRSFFRGSR